MEKISGFNTNDEPLELPPGFRFHPMDEELITHYLSPKVLDRNFNTRAIGEVDLNKVEPWDLPWRAKMGEKEWYFFCMRDRKYPTGSRTNRATESGYWKATGKDKEIFRAKILVGMKKTLVFYKGRAPKGEKTNWVMHEYRLEGKHAMHNLPKTSKNEWVICRIFKKSSGGKKVHISGLMRNNDSGDNSETSELPPLTDLSSDDNHARITEGSYVTCFSNQMEDPRDKFVDEFSSDSSKNCDYSPFTFNFPNDFNPDSNFSSHNIPVTESVKYPESAMMQDSSVLRLLLQNNATNTKQESKPEWYQNVCSANETIFKPYEDQEFPIISSASVDLDCLWNY